MDIRSIIENMDEHNVESEFSFSTSHIISGHMDKSTEEMETRLITESRETVSTFKSRLFPWEDIRSEIVNILKENVDLIDDWYHDRSMMFDYEHDTNCLKLEKDLDQKIGSCVYFDKSQGTINGADSNKMMLVIERDYEALNGLRVSTAYATGHKNEHRYQQIPIETVMDKHNINSVSERFAYIARHSLYENNKNIFVSKRETRDHEPYARCTMKINPQKSFLMDIYDSRDPRIEIRSNNGERTRIKDKEQENEMRKRYPKTFVYLDRMMKQCDKIKRNMTGSLFSERDSEKIKEHNYGADAIAKLKEKVIPQSEKLSHTQTKSNLTQNTIK